MRVVEPKVEIITPINGEDIIKHLEQVGRVCYKSEDKIAEESANKFISGIIKSGHEAVIEHFNITVKFTTDRGISHEIVRHRIASYAQESTRYVAYSKKAKEITSDDDVIYAYCEAGMSMKKIAEKSNNKYTEWDVYKILENNDIKKRNLGSRGIINENYFYEIDSPEKAYLLGFIFADGSIRKDLSQLTISQKEEEQWWILNMIRDFIQPDAKTLNIHNSKVCSDLVNKGIIPNKTYDFSETHADILWESIPEEYKDDFLRGLLDGDGSIRWFYQKENSKTMSCHIEWNGNKFLLEKIADYIHEKFRYESKVKKDSLSNCMYRYVISDSHVGKSVCDSMYKNFKFPYGHSKSCRYFEAFDLKIPCKKDDIDVRNFNVIIPSDISGKSLWYWGDAMLKSEIAYGEMLKNGCTAQIARSVLPTCTKTEIMVTMNMREWRHFIKLRGAKAAHPDIRILAHDLLKQFKEKIPVIFDDISFEVSNK